LHPAELLSPNQESSKVNELLRITAYGSFDLFFVKNEHEGSLAAHFCLRPLQALRVPKAARL
jgi:hypothetical protein